MAWDQSLPEALKIANKRIDELEKYNLDLANESHNKSKHIKRLELYIDSHLDGKYVTALKDLVSIVKIHSDATDNNFAWAELDGADKALNLVTPK